MTRPIRIEGAVRSLPAPDGLLCTATLRTDQKSWDGAVVPAGTSGTVVEVLRGGEAFVLDVAEPFDAIVTVRASELEARDDR